MYIIKKNFVNLVSGNAFGFTLLLQLQFWRAFAAVQYYVYSLLCFTGSNTGLYILYLMFDFMDLAQYRLYMASHFILAYR